jgi:hypothetical protein
LWKRLGRVCGSVLRMNGEALQFFWIGQPVHQVLSPVANPILPPVMTTWTTGCLCLVYSFDGDFGI